jgi:hypothetical protein
MAGIVMVIRCAILWSLLFGLAEKTIAADGQKPDTLRNTISGDQATSAPEIGIIKDADGYVNIRSEPTINSKVMGRLKQNDFVYFIRADSLWWKLTTRYGEGAEMYPPPPPEQNGYIHSSRIVPIKNLPISEIEGLYGKEWKKEKREIRLGNVEIALFNADRDGGSPLKVPESNSAYLEIRIPGKTAVRKYYPDIEGLGGAADIRYVPVSSKPDFRFFVKNGDYDGRTIIVAKDGRIADIGGGRLFVFKNFLISTVETDCCGEPLVFDLKLWKQLDDSWDDANLTVEDDPKYSFYRALGNLYLKVEWPDALKGDNTPRIFQFNKDGKFVRELNPPRMKEEIKALPDWQLED